jgi:hypothetical protein
LRQGLQFRSDTQRDGRTRLPHGWCLG